MQNLLNRAKKNNLIEDFYAVNNNYFVTFDKKISYEKRCKLRDILQFRYIKYIISLNSDNNMIIKEM